MKIFTIKLCIAYLILLWGLQSHSQVTVRITNMEYVSGSFINWGDPIEIEQGGNQRIRFNVDLTKPNNMVVGNSTLRIYAKGSSASPRSIDRQSICSGCWHTSHIVSKDITLQSSDFSTNGGVLYAEVESSSGIKYKSREWRVNIAVSSITNNSISGNQSIYSGDIPNALSGTTPSGGTGSFRYQWKKKTSGSWTNVSGATSRNYSPPALTTTTRYQRIVTSGSISSTSNTITVTVINAPPITNNSISGNQSIYSEDTPNALSGTTPSGGTGSFRYQWKKKTSGNWANISGATSRNYSPPALTTTTKYQRIVTSGGISSTSNTITVTVILAPPITTNSISSDQTIDEGEAPSTIIGSTPAGGSGRYRYTWQKKTTGNWSVISGATSKNYSPGILVKTTFYRRIVRSGGRLNTSNTVKITVNLLPEIRNNTIVFNGVSKIIGSVPTGGNNSYRYVYTTVIEINGEAFEDRFDQGTNKDWVIPEFFLNAARNGQELMIIRHVTSGIKESRTHIFLNKIENNSFVFDGVSKIIGSVPTGGTGPYTYQYKWFVVVEGGEPVHFSSSRSTNKDYTIPPDQMQKIISWDIPVYAKRIVWSNHQKHETGYIKIRSSSQGRLINSSVSIKNHEEKKLISKPKLYPNPTRGTVYLETDYIADTEVEIYIYSKVSGKGEKVFTQRIRAGKQTISWDIPARYPKGLYVYEIIENGISRHGKLVKK
ncbi:T9SS type A sorting domain-containing protein [Aquimarina aquimarini]|uniref:T9SS type A sorting domain-containing protein n=1 Tax=Aquimarina aquimarini TaxID=1191734 RepID=UPI000D55C66E|nr:T9SS type A sorting domain-containing protein [Aquimarina aquimarini]